MLLIKSYSPDEIENEMGGTCSTYVGEGGAYVILVGKLEAKRPLGRPRRRCVDNIKVDIQEVGCVVWTGSIWLRVGTGSGNL